MRAGAWIDREGPVHALAAARIVVAIAVFRHAVPFVVERTRGQFFGDHFFVPYAGWIPQPGRVAYDVILAAMLASAAFAAAGFRTRLALGVCALATGWHLALNQLWFSNNKLLLVLCLTVLAVSPAGRALSVDAWRAGGQRDPIGPTWTAGVLRAQVSVIYLASAGAKLFDPAWRSGDVMVERVTSWPAFDRLAPSLQALVDSGAGHAALGLGPIALEIFLAVGLHLPATRRGAFWLGLLFHGLIEAIFNVLVFSQLMAGLYLLFAVPPRNGRVLRFDPARLAPMPPGVAYLAIPAAALAAFVLDARFLLAGPAKLAWGGAVAFALFAAFSARFAPSRAGEDGPDAVRMAAPEAR